MHTQQRAKNSLLGPVTQVEEDVDRIQTLLKETFYFNYFIDNLISYFTLVFTFICMYTFKHPLRTMYLYSKSPVKVCHLYLLTAISEILVYAIFISVVLLTRLRINNYLVLLFVEIHFPSLIGTSSLVFFLF